MREYIHESNIHAPQSGQYAYTRAMEVMKMCLQLLVSLVLLKTTIYSYLCLHIFQQFDAVAQEKLKSHYRPLVDSVSTVLRETKLAFSHPDYRVGGTFYVLSEFIRLRGLPVHIFLDVFEFSMTCIFSILIFNFFIIIS